MKTFAYTTRYKTLPGDLHTPVSTYLKVRDLFPQSILLESSDYHGVENNRSFYRTEPHCQFLRKPRNRDHGLSGQKP